MSKQKILDYIYSDVIHVKPSVKSNGDCLCPSVQYSGIRSVAWEESGGFSSKQKKIPVLITLNCGLVDGIVRVEKSKTLKSGEVCARMIEDPIDINFDFSVIETHPAGHLVFFSLCYYISRTLFKVSALDECDKLIHLLLCSLDPNVQYGTKSLQCLTSHYYDPKRREETLTSILGCMGFSCVPGQVAVYPNNIKELDIVFPGEGE